MNNTFQAEVGFPANLTVSSRLVLNLHDLNNEGSEGNYLQTRMVTVVSPEGEIQNVNAISGDMLKHMVVVHFQRIALEQGLPLCEGCKKLDPNRITVDKNFTSEIKGASDKDIVAKMIQWCALDDIFGNMYTGNKKSVARKSAVEVGWVVGIPEATRTESYLHVKFVKGDQKSKQSNSESADDGSNVGQNIFHRPANSGIYAFVMNIDFTRIGWNDYTYQYEISVEERKKRAKALIEALSAAFLRPEGAMRNTQLPHITSMEGVVSLSSMASLPAPNISPLNGRYAEEMGHIIERLNEHYGEVQPLTAFEFDSMERFIDYMYGLAEGMK